ncbi:MAG: hypothetical protein M1821_000259 [Bathelium mastoideum]|nr:MAG: hypothetical protein M1821_000259 [Bathelium mastoideum]
MFQNKGFDLAVFAVSTQRLGISENDIRYQNLSLSAYSTVLQVHRKLVDSSRPSPMLAAISALLMFLEAAQPQGSPSVRRVGHQSHFKGTIALMEACGPEHFQARGYHDIFKKLRDMHKFGKLLPKVYTDVTKVFSALFLHHRTIFASPAWRRVPWVAQPRTWRDTLMDVALDMTESTEFHVLQDRLTSWHQRWLQQFCPGKLVCTRGCQKYCFCSLPPISIPKDEFALLQGEFWAFSLLLLDRRRNDLAMSACAGKKFQSPDAKELDAACGRVSTDLAMVLALPCFGQDDAGKAESRGISEGRSRSLLCSSVLDLFQEPFSEDVWWKKVAGRLNGVDS